MRVSFLDAWELLVGVREIDCRGVVRVSVLDAEGGAIGEKELDCRGSVSLLDAWEVQVRKGNWIAGVVSGCQTS